MLSGRALLDSICVGVNETFRDCRLGQIGFSSSRKPPTLNHDLFEPQVASLADFANG
jgi:hypothetical protein